MKTIFRALLVLMVVGSSLPAKAQADLIDRWYVALGAADAPALDGLMRDDAVIVLTDIDVEQSKAEFLASMEGWKESVADAKIRHRVEHTEGDVTTALVCYDFPANDMMIREVFTVVDGKVGESRQNHVADDCDAF